MNEEQKNKLRDRINETIKRIIERHGEDFKGNGMFDKIMENSVNFIKIQLIKSAEENPEEVKGWIKTFRNAVKKDLKDLDKLLK